MTSVRQTRYAVVSGDLVLSRRLADRRRVQRQLMKLCEHVNSQFQPDLAAPFMITLGDEIQGLLAASVRFPAVVTSIHTVFRPEAITAGVGLGGIPTRVSPRVIERNGPALVHARHAVEAAQKRGFEVSASSGDEGLDRAVS